MVLPEIFLSWIHYWLLKCQRQLRRDLSNGPEKTEISMQTHGCGEGDRLKFHFYGWLFDTTEFLLSRETFAAGFNVIIYILV